MINKRDSLLSKSQHIPVLQVDGKYKNKTPTELCNFFSISSQYLEETTLAAAV